MNKEQVWDGIPSEGSLRFRTDSDGTGMWRDLLAWQPCASFQITRISELPALLDFLDLHQKKLCSGYFSYDLGRLLLEVQSRHSREEPLAVIHAYDNWIEYDQDEPKIVGHVAREEIKDDSRDAGGVPEHSNALEFTPDSSDFAYKGKIAQIQDLIRAGDFYQLNYTQRMKAVSQGRVSYSEMLARHPAAYAMAFEFDDYKIHSLSPELFLHYGNGVLTTEPIKGTRPRGKTQHEDDAQRQALMGSEKEQAELFMITDLLRNDLGKVSEIGSISLEAVKDIRKLPRVWHTFSRISGRLRKDLQPIDALLSMLPGGSITGCPKKHSMEIIDELENNSRGIYTGAMGYFHPDGDFSFNIAIRTLVQKDKELSLGSGGGITIDSRWDEEWQELLVKASTF